MAGAGAENPRAIVEVWEVTRAAEHATQAQRAEALAMLTGEAAPLPELKPIQIDVLQALHRREADLPLSAVDLSLEAKTARAYVGYVLDALYAYGIAVHVKGGWQLTDKGREMRYTL